MPYLPNPVAFSAIKGVGYCALGGAATWRATLRARPVLRALGFGASRAVAGWAAGCRSS